MEFLSFQTKIATSEDNIQFGLCVSGYSQWFRVESGIAIPEKYTEVYRLLGFSIIFFLSYLSGVSGKWIITENKK